ncbi:MAG TPA: ORF6N domain-containing protein [bacterium]|nr:ORF6N domain-containing protein [bacterium]HQB10711.1 ORF6N domain-containing protein [bacterium]HQM85353.1 ORF6N domain-containing protein [bacterium]HRQ71182.1 ORF6N domain-containing protein [bacterium]
MAENELIHVDDIKSRIFTIRGMQVMLDKDLAAFYGVKPRRLREQVKRNIKRFPPDFMFQLTEIEADFMVSQNATPSKQQFGGFLPYAFTEQGVAAVSAVITSEKAIEVNIMIVRAFVAMRHFIEDKSNLFKRVDSLEIKQIEADKKFDMLFKAMEGDQLPSKQGVLFEGQVFEAHKFVSDIIRSAEKSIILIDNYVDDTVLTLFSKRKQGVVLKILTKNLSKQLILDTQKFNEQFPPAEIKEFNHSHDRFMIIDDKDLYHFGASLKDLGKKWFGFSKMNVKVTKMLAKI